MSEQTSSPPQRRYDKGERRHKHVGRGPEPEIEFVPGNPRMWIGKCPSTLKPAERERLLNDAIAGGNGDRELSFSKKLYVVHQGAIYEAQTSDRGKSYHGALSEQLHRAALPLPCDPDFGQQKSHTWWVIEGSSTAGGIRISEFRPNKPSTRDEVQLL